MLDNDDLEIDSSLTLLDQVSFFDNESLNTILQLTMSQVIGIFKLITENTETALEDVMNVDMISSMQMLATCITRISSPSTDRIKIKYCGICESVCSRMDSLTIRKESPARYMILDILLQWMSESVCFLAFTLKPRLNIK